MKRIYMDYNATTPLDPRVLEAMMPYFKDEFGNPSSIHSYGRGAKAALDAARERVASFIGASPGEIVFTGGGSEGNNFAIKGAASAALDRRGNHLITTRVEHESVLETFKHLQASGFRVTYLGVDGYCLPDPEELREAITDETVLVSCMYANNETGTIMPVEEVAEIVKERGVILHVDAVQAAGKIDIDLGKLPADLLTISAHKFYGPKGVGALFVRDGLIKKLSTAPLIHGGGQERGTRSGTENVAGIVGLGVASSLAESEAASDRERIRGMRDGLYEKISSGVDGAWINGHTERMLSNTLNLGIGGVSGVSLSMGLDLEGIAVSTGSACSEGNVDPSHVLLAMGLSREEASSSVRFSLGRFSREEDIDLVSQAVIRAVDRIRGVGNIASSRE